MSPASLNNTNLDEKKKEYVAKVVTFANLDVIVIDEISMVRADMMDCIDMFLREVR